MGSLRLQPDAGAPGDGRDRRGSVGARAAHLRNSAVNGCPLLLSRFDPIFSWCGTRQSMASNRAPGHRAGHPCFSSADLFLYMFLLQAFSINYADICIRWGLYESALRFVGWPIIPGFDLAGRWMLLLLLLRATVRCCAVLHGFWSLCAMLCRKTLTTRLHASSLFAMDGTQVPPPRHSSSWRYEGGDTSNHSLDITPRTQGVGGQAFDAKLHSCWHCSNTTKEKLTKSQRIKPKHDAEDVSVGVSVGSMHWARKLSVLSRRSGAGRGGLGLRCWRSDLRLQFLRQLRDPTLAWGAVSGPTWIYVLEPYEPHVPHCTCEESEVSLCPSPKL